MQIHYAFHTDYWLAITSIGQNQLFAYKKRAANFLFEPYQCKKISITFRYYNEAVSHQEQMRCNQVIILYRNLFAGLLITITGLTGSD